MNKVIAGSESEVDTKYKEFEHCFFDTFSDQDVTATARFKKPTWQQADRAQKEMMKSPARAMGNLCQSVVHPDDKAGLTRDFGTWPGLASTFGGALLKVSGFGELGN